MDMGAPLSVAETRSQPSVIPTVGRDLGQGVGGDSSPRVPSGQALHCASFGMTSIEIEIPADKHGPGRQ
jgi:hypothetical protein